MVMLIHHIHDYAICIMVVEMHHSCSHALFFNIGVWYNSFFFTLYVLQYYLLWRGLSPSIIELWRWRKTKLISSLIKTDPFEERTSKVALRQGPRFQIVCVYWVLSLCSLSPLHVLPPPPRSPPSSSGPLNYCTNTSDLEVRPLPGCRFTNIFFKRVGFDKRRY